MTTTEGRASDDVIWAEAKSKARFWGPKALLLGLATVTFFGVLGFACSWIGKTSSIVSADNFETQHFQLQQDYESLEAIAGNACSAKSALDAAVERGAGEEAISQRESQLLAHESNYRRVKADYDRRMANFFETLDGFVAPPDLPDVAPSLNSMLEVEC